MSLQICTECKKEVSSKATTCVHCGNPVGGVTKSQGIELTGKKYKKRALIYMFIFIVGVLFAVNKHLELAIPLLLIAFVGGLINRFGAWWNNG